MSITEQWKPDPAKVAAVIADAEAEVAVQQLLVDKLDELLDQEQHELTRRERRVEELRDTWRKHGVEVPR